MIGCVIVKCYRKHNQIICVLIYKRVIIQAIFIPLIVFSIEFISIILQYIVVIIQPIGALTDHRIIRINTEYCIAISFIVVVNQRHIKVRTKVRYIVILRVILRHCYFAADPVVCGFGRNGALTGLALISPERFTTATVGSLVCQVIFLSVPVHFNL